MAAPQSSNHVAASTPAATAQVAYEEDYPASPSDEVVTNVVVAATPHMIQSEDPATAQLQVAAPTAMTQASTSLSLAELEALAAANNPALMAANATITKANGLRYQVGLKANPILGYFGSQIADESTDQHGLFVEQEFVRGNKLELNRRVLTHTSRMQQHEAEIQLLKVLTDIRVQFFAALAAQQQLDAIQAFAEVARKGVDISDERIRAQEGTRVELLQSKTLLAEIELAERQTRLAYQAAWQRLTAVAGIPNQTPVRLEADFDLPQASPNWDTALLAILAQSPELMLAQEEVCEKQAILRRQQAQPIPNVTAQMAGGYDNGTNSGLINLQFGAPLPVHNRNRGNISAAYADYTRALETVNLVENSLRSRMALATQEFESALAAVNQYQDQIIPQAQETLNLSEEAFRAGELDFLQVLVVRRVFFESNIQSIQAQGRLAQATARIDGLLLEGGLDAPRDFTSGDELRGQTFGGQ